MFVWNVSQRRQRPLDLRTPIEQYSLFFPHTPFSPHPPFSHGSLIIGLPSTLYFHPLVPMHSSVSIHPLFPTFLSVLTHLLGPYA